MADEQVKKTTPKKRSTTSKPKVEEEKTTNSLEDQMAQMMAMMMAQQQQIMELMAKQQQPKGVVEEEEERKEQRKTKRTRSSNKMNKQELRRKYKDVDIYVSNVSQGLVIYQAKNNLYEWQNPGDIEIMTIEDIINMPRTYLHTPWVVLDGYENEEELIDDIVTVLKIEPVYEYIYTLQDMEEDIENVELDDIRKAIQLSRKHGCDISMDITVLVERKIRNKELTNYHMIAELGEILGRKFM